jgi:YHS domain-containing protein
VKHALILGMALLALAACSTNHRLLAPDHEAKYALNPEKPDSPPKRGVDPVCGASMDSVEAFWHSTYRGADYLFDSKECKEQFDAHPDLYAGVAR